MRVVAQVNKYLTNPVQRLWAPRLRYMAVVEHRGRRSGRAYRTPVMAFVGDDQVCIVLNYGEQSDWVRNVMTAGSAELFNRGTRYALSKPRVLDADSAELPGAVRAISSPGRRVLHATLTPA
jgi:deazaflavin-dependent oxidoreductase (nitroreductase family)